MRFTQQEKYEIIRLVEDSEIGVSRTLLKLGIHKSTFYNCMEDTNKKDMMDSLLAIERLIQPGIKFLTR